MTTRRLGGQEGMSLIEVIISTGILGVALVGLTLLLSRGQAFVVEQGDTRVALHLAQQKIEKFRALGFSAAKVENNGHLSYADPTANSKCGDPSANYEQCYNETLSPGTGTGAGAGLQTPSQTQVDTQTFTRLTCVRWVQDDNPELPADVLEPPSAWTCPSCNPLLPDGTQNPICTKNTKRIKVAVIPRVLGNPNDTTPLDPNRATLETVLTTTARP